MNKDSLCRQIEITQHGKQRLEERVITHEGFHSWKHMVKTARYQGKSKCIMTDAEYQ